MILPSQVPEQDKTRKIFPMTRIHNCPGCLCDTHIRTFIELMLTKASPDLCIPTSQAWLRYAEWSKLLPTRAIPGLTQNQLTRQLREHLIPIEPRGRLGNCIIGYTLMPPILIG